MADLEQGDGMDLVDDEHGTFTGSFGVAFEESGGETVVDAEDNGVVVPGRPAVGVCERGGERGDVELAQVYSVAGVEVTGR